MILIDAGNSSLRAAHWTGAAYGKRFRSARAGEWERAFAAWLRPLPPERIVIASVVPEVTERLRALFSRANRPVLVLDPVCHAILPHRLSTPETTGIDRLCAARAARDRTGGAVVVADIGTAVTVDAVDIGGVFRGGAILPGPALWLSALSCGTARLPRIDAALSSSALGDGTEAAIRSGLSYGLAGAVERLVEEHRASIGCAAPLCLTGGAAPLLRPLLRLECLEAPDLVLDGARAAAGEIAESGGDG